MRSTLQHTPNNAICVYGCTVSNFFLLNLKQETLQFMNNLLTGLSLHCVLGSYCYCCKLFAGVLLLRLCPRVAQEIELWTEDIVVDIINVDNIFAKVAIRRKQKNTNLQKQLRGPKSMRTECKSKRYETELCRRLELPMIWLTRVKQELCDKEQKRCGPEHY